jgi:hypothetical protein
VFDLAEAQKPLTLEGFWGYLLLFKNIV